MDFVLFETATGYGLFSVNEVEDIGAMVDSMQASIQNIATLNKLVKLVSFVPFTTSEEALENMNAITEGVLPDTLKNFITTNVPSGKILGVVEDKLASAIAEACPGVTCNKTKTVVELQRCIRLHFEKTISALKEGDLDKAQLGLAHSYSRSKVKFNVNRNDNMVIQSICLLDQMDKDVNTFSMRMREWYSWHFPELLHVVDDNYIYARCVKAITRKESLLAEDEESAINRIRAAFPSDVQEEEALAKSKQILEAAKTSMGYEISDLDLMSILAFAERVVSLTEYKHNLSDYLNKKMSDIAPNLSALIGETIGARLIAKAGSLTNLAKYPASTVQILGAEKALFRALKTRGKTPKYGLIYHSSFIGRAGAKNKGRISRYLANKASIASRIDSFGDPSAAIGNKFGLMLKDQVEERLTFYDSGKVPRKNTECMQNVLTDVEAAKVAEAAEAAAATPEKKHHHKKRASQATAEIKEEPVEVKMEEDATTAAAAAAPVKTEEAAEVTPSKKKHRKSKAAAEPAPEAMQVEEAPVAPAAAEPSPKKKKKKSLPTPQ